MRGILVFRPRNTRLELKSEKNILELAYGNLTSIEKNPTRRHLNILTIESKVYIKGK